MRFGWIWICALGHAAFSFAGALPSFFVPNAGQFDDAIRFAVQAPDFQAAFTRDGAVYQAEGVRLRVQFEGASEHARVEGGEPLSAQASFFLGANPARWRTGLATYREVIYRQLYPGIDAAYTARGRVLKSEFMVAPGGDPKAIRMRYPGADRVRIVDGELFVRIGAAEFREKAPEVFQSDAQGLRSKVEASYRIREDGTVGFDLGPYDSEAWLVIDPVITYSTYLGGSGAGAVTAVARDGLGQLYAAGWTESLDFPIAGAAQAVNRGGVDAFVVKLSQDGSTLLYATYIGGNGDDRAAGIAVDGLGQAHVAGATGSSNFPLVAAARTTFAGGKEGFALKLNAGGYLLEYSTYLGGSNHDVATGIAVDASGFAYVAGDTLSTDFGLLGAVQASPGGKFDAFLVKLDSAGVRVFSTFLGGSQDEHAGGIAAGAAGEIYLAGGTFSPNFPVVGAIQPVSGGGQDAFLTKIQTAGPAQILFSTFLGGSGGTLSAPEQANAVALDSSGNPHLAGVTSSTNFPVSPGSLQSNAGGSRDVFITKFSASGNARLYSTYLGWTGFDWGSGIAVDASGNAYVGGYTSSVSFANVGGVQSGFRGLYDGFLLKLNPTGNNLAFSTLYGGTGSDVVNAITVDGDGNIFAGGQTSSFDFPTQSAYQGTNSSGNTGWVARIGASALPAQLPSADDVNLTNGSGGSAVLTAQFSHPGGAAALSSVAVLLSRTASIDFACYVTYSPATNTLMLANDVVSSGGASVSPGTGSAANSQCQLLGPGSGAVLTGNTLTLTLSLSLDAGFPGTNTVYLYAAAGSVNTGWVAKAGVSQVSADSVSPSSGSGAAQTFTFVFSDTKSANNVLTTAMMINSSLTGSNGCWLVFDRAANTVALLWDNATGSHAKPIGSSATIQNSQCALGIPTMTVSGTSIILSLPLAFKGPFTGPKNIYMYAVGPNGNTGWVQRGTFSVVAGGVPVANGVSPASGSGAQQTFSFTMSDQAGSSFLVAAAMLFTPAPGFNLNNACYVVYDRAAGRFSLFANSVSGGASQLSIGSSGSVSNSQCTLYGPGSTVTIGATSITVNLNLAFSPSFAGSKNSFLFVSENGFNTGWVSVGSWNVPGTPPAISSLSPTSGNGSTNFFVATATTAVSPTDLTRIALRFSPAGAGASCRVEYNRPNATIGLYADDGTTLNVKSIGSSLTLENNVCAVGYSVVNVVGGSVALTVQLVFKSAFTGTQTVSLEAANAWGSSGFVTSGTWTIPSR